MFSDQAPKLIGVLFDRPSNVFGKTGPELVFGPVASEMKCRKHLRIKGFLDPEVESCVTKIEEMYILMISWSLLMVCSHLRATDIGSQCYLPPNTGEHTPSQPWSDRLVLDLPIVEG